MAGGAQQLVRLNVPNTLGAKESHESLRAWETKVRTYFARDTLFNRFFNAGECSNWDRALANCGFLDDVHGPAPNRVTALVKKAHLDLFIDNLLGFMPNVFLVDSFHAATSLEDIFRIIRNSYGVETTARSQLDLSALQMQAGETYHAFFDRFVAHAQQHLVQPGVPPVRGIAVMHAQNGDSLSISHLNTLTLWWMSKIHVDLPAVVQLELSDVLRQPGVTLSSLVMRISESADSWLAKNEKTSVHLIQSDKVEDPAELTDYSEKDIDDLAIGR